jgi:DnaK suppressor protein
MEKANLLMFKAQVEQRREELLRWAGTAFHEGRELTRDGPEDFGDQAALTASRELLFQQESRNYQQLRLLEIVLHRMEAGSFGRCRRCGEEIGIRRLRALPWADYCLKCQQSIEEGKGKLRPAY